jgi:hypothetical protein
LGLKCEWDLPVVSFIYSNLLPVVTFSKLFTHYKNYTII